MVLIHDYFREISGIHIDKSMFLQTESEFFLNDSEYGMFSRDDNNLRIIFYKRGETNLGKEYLLKLRGIIYDLETGEIIMQSLYGGIDFDKITTYDINSLQFYESIDGTLINVYYHNDKWNYSTKGMIDADTSRWFSNKSFKSLFMESINDSKLDIDSLDTNFCYSFILNHPLNRIVTFYDKPCIVHICTRDIKTLKSVNIDLGVQKPNNIKIDSWDDFEKKITSLTYNEEGIMIFNHTTNERCKIKGKTYLEVKELIGNHKDLQLRILSLGKEAGKIQDYLMYYPEHRKKNVEVHNNIKSLITKILEVYTSVKKERKYIEIPKFLRKTIYKIHDFYHEIMNKYTNGELNKKPSINYRGIHIYFLKLHIYEQNYLLNNLQIHLKSEQKSPKNHHV